MESNRLKTQKSKIQIVMKKLALFAAALCCMVSASAQHIKSNPMTQKSLKDKIQQVEKWNRYENTFSEKLDSIYTDYEKGILAYDERFNCTKIDYYANWGGWMLEYTEEYTYDDKDRVVMVVRKAGEYEEYGDKSEYTYNDEGWLTEELEYELEGGEWMLVNKYTYEYDADGHMVLSIGYAYDGDWLEESKMTFEYEGGLLRNDVFYYYEDDDWMPNTRNDYTYNAQDLCTETLASNWEGEWVENYKYEYEYDAAGNRLSTTESNRYDMEDWMYTTRIEYAYDSHNNCTEKASYYYESELDEWVLEYTMLYTYDLSVPVENTAGIFMVWENELPIYDKVLNWQVQYGDIAESTVLFYSGCVGLDETTESRLSVWPNPASETLNLNAEGWRQAEILTLEGRLVATANNGFATIAIGHLAKGCYLLRVTFEDGREAIQKFVKQ